MNDYKTQDLSTYAKVFFRQSIIGGMKGFKEPDDLSDWVTRARFLLLQLQESDIEYHFDPHYVLSHWHRIVAVWLAALTKQKQFMDTACDFLYSNPLNIFKKKAVHQDSLPIKKTAYL